MNSLYHRPDQVTNTLEINRELHAGEEFTRLRLGHLSDGGGRGIIHLPFDLVQFLFALSHRQTGVAYRVLVDMIAGLLVGGFLGYWLDRWLGWAPWSLVTGLIVGFVAGANNAWRAIRAYSRDAAKAGGSDEERRLP